MSSETALMSDSDAGREWQLFIADMISFGERILAYTEGSTQAEFVADGKTYDAVLRNLELLGPSAACTSSVSPASRVAIRALAIASCALAPTHSNAVPGPRCGSVCRSIAAVPLAAAIIAVPSSAC